MITPYPDIFFGNPYIDHVFKTNKKRKISFFLRKYIQQFQIPLITPNYTSYNITTDQDEIPVKHIINLMCDRAHVMYSLMLKPEIYLTKKEIQTGKLYDNQICIQTAGSGAKYYMRNKDWYPERFQEVVDRLKDKYTILQIGSGKDFPLKGVVDLREKTTIRETAALLYHSRFFVGLVGFLMHLARSVDCRSVILYGGRETPEQSGYPENKNLYSSVSCSPCWYWNFCPNNRLCMEKIASSDVSLAITQLENDFNRR